MWFLNGGEATTGSGYSMRVEPLSVRLMKLPGVVGVRIKVTKLEIFPDCQVAISAECGTW